MRLNDDFAARVLVDTEATEWQDSPMSGVQRKPLDRIGGEVARATTIVRFAPGSRFSPHTHDGGEEYIVLDGVFQDEQGDFPAGTYVRNPPTSRHTPRSDPGCTIFVKLWQFRPEDRTEVRRQILPGGERGSARLHEDEEETVSAVSLAPSEEASLDTDGGAEILVLDGSVSEAGDLLRRHAWLRLPDGYDARLLAGDDGATLWVKSGHLRNIRIPEAAG